MVMLLQGWYNQSRLAACGEQFGRKLLRIKLWHRLAPRYIYQRSTSTGLSLSATIIHPSRDDKTIAVRSGCKVSLQLNQLLTTVRSNRRSLGHIGSEWLCHEF